MGNPEGDTRLANGVRRFCGEGRRRGVGRREGGS